MARIACVKHGFTEAPGLVRFEQEIDRELAAEKESAIGRSKNSCDELAKQSASGNRQNNETMANGKLSSLVRSSRGGSIAADATDDLIMRYCLHKEEEAARKKAAEIEARLQEQQAEEERQEALRKQTATMEKEASMTALAKQIADSLEALQNDATINQSDVTYNDDQKQTALCDTDLNGLEDKDCEHSVIKSPSGDMPTAHNRHNLTYDNRVDSLDSGEGRTESTSTGDNRTPVNSNQSSRKHSASAIPVPIKRSNSNLSLISNPSSSIGTSEISSSRSSLLSGQESNSTTKRHIASDLDGKVMRIAKSYYGKGATKGVTRLSEGKYKIADRIVFVRLLKGHRVMVRIGGGWDTLENFLFRHKSDPSQVIDVDNLLPLETKMTFEKSLQLTPTNNKFSKLPYYHRSSSASSTNLSISNLSVSNHSPTSSSSTSTTTNNVSLQTQHNSGGGDSGIVEPTPRKSTNKQIPYFLIHRGQNTRTTPQQAFYNQNETSSQSYLNGPIKNQPQKIQNTNSKFNHRLLGNSRTPTASTTNLYPATLTTRLASTTIKPIGAATRLNSATNLHTGKTAKQEAFRKLGRSNDSLLASYYKSPQHRQHPQNGSSIQHYQQSNLSAKRKIDTNRKSTNGLVRKANI